MTEEEVHVRTTVVLRHEVLDEPSDLEPSKTIEFRLTEVFHESGDPDLVFTSQTMAALAYLRGKMR